MSDSFIGRQVGKYEILEKLGQGGMGKVYKGRQTSLNRLVAIKVLPAQLALDPEFVQRFRQEALVIAELQHENIVHIYDVDSVPHAGGDDLWFIVMEYVDGYNLRERPGGSRAMAAADVRSIGLALADALEYAHQRGIVHRDIKSANVMVTREGKIKLMDFGVAKSAGGIRTATGSVLGTPDYMSPEQARGGEIGPYSDIYSLGVLLYELSTGRLPFSGGDPFQVAFRHVSETPPAPSSIVPTLPEWLETVILKCLEKDPGDRYPSATELEQDLEQLPGTTDLDATIRTPPGGASLLPPESPRPETDPHAPTLPTTPSPVSAAAPSPTAAPSSTPAPSSGAPSDSAPDLPPPPPLPSATPAAPAPAAAELPPSPGPAEGSRSWLWGALIVVAILALGGLAWMIANRTELPEQVDAGNTELAAAGPAAAGPAAAGLPTLPAEVHRQALAEARRLLAEARFEDALATLPAEDGSAHDSQVAELRQEIETRRSTTGADDAEGRGSAPRSPTAASPSAAPPSAAPPSADSRTSQTDRRPRPSEIRASAEELWQRAQGEKDDERYHSLRQTLAELAELDMNYARSARWRSKIGNWVEGRESDLREELEDALDDLMDALEDEEPDALADLWGGRLDSGTRRWAEGLWQRFRKVKGSWRIESFRPHDHRADFVVVIDLEVRRERWGKFAPHGQVRWSGALEDRDGVRFLKPLQ